MLKRKRVEDMRVVSVRYSGAYEEAERHFEWLRRQVEAYIVGPAFCLYTDRAVQGGVVVECCYPVCQAAEAAGVQCRVLEGGEMYAAVHYGPHRTLGEAWGALFDYIEANNIPVRGPRREIYLQGGEGEESVTELQVPVG